MFEESDDTEAETVEDKEADDTSPLGDIACAVEDKLEAKPIDISEGLE
jgi:hypothetical protein